MLDHEMKFYPIELVHCHSKANRSKVNRFSFCSPSLALSICIYLLFILRTSFFSLLHSSVYGYIYKLIRLWGDRRARQLQFHVLKKADALFSIMCACKALAGFRLACFFLLFSALLLLP